MNRDTSTAAVSQRYETIFSVFMLAVVFLYRNNTHLVFPTIFYLFALLLAVNLAAGLVLRRWPTHVWAAVLIVLGNCGLITAILDKSGGPLSNLWVLYLLPIYTVCLLLNGVQTALIVAGIISFNAVFYFLRGAPSSVASGFDISLRTGLFLFAAGVTWKFAQKDRQARDSLARQRADIERVESQLVEEQARGQEARTMADIGQLAAGIAHDLAGPLTVIAGTAKMLLEDAAAEPFRPDLERIVRAVQLGETISQNVPGAARERGMSLKECDVRSVVEAALQVYEPMLSGRNILVERRFADTLPPVNASAAHLERIFLNLMSNARGAMPNGGVLRLTVEPVFQGPNRAPWVQAVVEDTGSGIAPEMMARLFKPFNTSKAPGEGTGLGLYLSRQIAMDHGGRLTVENRAEGGARFTLALPAAAALTRAA